MSFLQNQPISAAISDTVIAARGRGLAKLIENLYQGDVTSWILVGVAVAIFAGVAIYKQMNGGD